MTMPELVNLNFKIVVPQAATNLVTNPSLETNTTGYTAVGGATLTRSATHQRRGAWALRITPVASTESGTYFGTVSVTSGTAYVFSVDVLGVAGQSYELQLQNTTPTERASLTFTGTGYWQRLEVTFTATADEDWRLYVVRDAGETGTDYFYIDGLQFETGSAATTYFDGDSIGFVRGQKDFGWNGTRHGSTSYRTAKTRAGGSLLDMSDYCTLAGVMGLGMGTFSQHYTNIITGGAVYEGHTRKPRNFSLLLHYTGSMSDIWDDKNAILDAIRPDYTGIFQPMVLRFQGTDASGNEATEPLDIVCIPQVSHTDPPQTPALQEDILSFTALDSILPGAYQEGAELDFADSLANANRIIMRDSDGIFANLGSGLNGTVFALATDASGNLYAGGAFTTAGGVTVNRIAKWDGSTWSALGSGVNDTVFDIIFDNNGNLYATGSFTLAGGVANTVRIAKWDGTNWSPLGTGLSGGTGGGMSLALDASGNLYCGGYFTTAGGVTVNRIAKWDGSLWDDLDSGVGGASPSVYSLAFAANGDLYVGGTFDTVGAGSLAVKKFAKWDGSSWSNPGDGIGAGGYINCMAFAPNGDLYIGGDFTISGGSSANYLTIWNGASFFPSSSGSPNNSVESLAFSEDGSLYVGGVFSAVGELTLSDRIAVLKNGTWQTLSADLPGTPSVYSVFVTDRDEFYIGFSTAGTATVAGTITATNGGGANCYPKMRINGPGTLHKLINNTTGAQITFANLTLLTGEILTINFEPGNISAESTYRGNCLSYIAPGSDLADFHLRKGTNSISFLMTGTDGDTSAEMIWTPTFGNIEGSRYA